MDPVVDSCQPRRWFSVRALGVMLLEPYSAGTLRPPVLKLKMLGGPRGARN